MSYPKTDDIHVKSFEPLICPENLRKEIPNSLEIIEKISEYREHIRNIMGGSDKRLLVIVGPCSIHDPNAGLEYARKLKALAEKVSEKIFVVMRVYFEKPRTTVGWKGLINDPHLDGSIDIERGLFLARKMLSDIAYIGLPSATEFLDPIVPHYLADLVSWVAIGARTTESQTHRELASGLSMPVGFKNATDGSLEVASNAMISAQSQHGFLGIDKSGRTAIVKTAGNPDVHIILRGGVQGSNYDKESLLKAQSLLGDDSNKRLIMVDCSHGNSNKDYRQQPEVFHHLIEQFRADHHHIMGMMLESFLVEGNQKINTSHMTYGQSVTDACISFSQTESLLLEAAEKL